MVHWCNLPFDLVDKIEEHIVSYVDQIRFRCVCVSWQLPWPKQFRQPQLPWLLLPYNSKHSGSKCGFFNPRDKKIYERDLPELGEKVFKGTYDGWVVIAEEDASIYAVNPFSRARVELPPRTKFPDVIKYRPHQRDNQFHLRQLINRTVCLDSTHVRNYMLTKIVLSASPDSTDFVAVALYGVQTQLAYCRYGDKKWHVLSPPEFGYEDAIFYEGKLYAIRFSGQLSVWDNIYSFPHLRLLVPRHPTTMKTGYRLVHSHMGLMMMFRHEKVKILGQEPEEKFLGKTRAFNNIYKFDMSASRWIRVNDIGGDIFFMGLGAQMRVSSREFTEFKGNTIYFSGENLNFNCEGVKGCFDEGICDLDTRKINSLGRTYDPYLIWPSPIWIMPHPY